MSHRSLGSSRYRQTQTGENDRGENRTLTEWNSCEAQQLPVQCKLQVGRQTASSKNVSEEKPEVGSRRPLHGIPRTLSKIPRQESHKHCKMATIRLCSDLYN
jgi:hypothetical protein